MATDPLIGRIVDSRYEIVDHVARGGMATVYSAHDRRLDRRVALKLMHPHLADSPDFVARFRREARAAARLSNPGVVAVYDQGSLDGVAYLVMELVEGPNLRDLLATGPLSVKEALSLSAQILRPLGAAHRAGLVHRDIKPENVLLPSDGGVAKVADFGLARAATEASQTTTGNVLGTVAYLAPELITTGTSSPRADVYAVGIILYELLTGEQPFTADSPIQIAFHNVHDDVPAPSALVAEVPARVDELVEAMTRRAPEERLADADTALEVVRSTMDGLTPSELAVRRGGGSGSVRTQEVLAANAEAARQAEQGEDSAASPDPAAGARTVSLPIGSIGPNPTHRIDKSDRDALQADNQATTPLAVRTRGLRRRTLIGAAAAVVLGTSGAAIWYVTAGPGREETVPEIVGMAQDKAMAAVKAASLSWARPSKDYSDTVPSGHVISCKPAPGARVAVGTSVQAVVSRGIEQKEVPDVVGKSRDNAEDAIKKAGLHVGAVTTTFSDTVAEGQVVSTDPPAGTMVNHSSAVALVVSAGRQPATVPDVTGLTLEEAKKRLKEAGLSAGTTSEEFSDTVAKGKVVSQDPKAGAKGQYRGGSVNMVVSKGPETVEVPDVTSMSQEEATSALEAAGLVVEVSTVLGGLFGSVRSVDPPAGTKVPKGSTVTIEVF